MSGSSLVELTIPKPAPVPPRGPDYQPQHRRRVLCVFPRYTHSFGTFDHAFPLMRVRAFMPPQGILLIAAYMPREWEVRFVDENISRATEADYRWADVVFISGMHVQRDRIREINERAHSFGKITVLGGPSVSSSAEWYVDVDLLHLGEMGDATDRIIERLDRSVERPERQEVYTTEERLPLADFPLPAYHLLNLTDYFLASVQFSSGCPYRCEFCDIPELYGRNPRLKTPEQVTAELDAMLARGNPGCVYFVDDNFIGNKKAAVELLQALVKWQEERGYPIQFACEATLNLAQAPDVLELMREACFYTVFCGIETPEEHALQAMMKKQNLRQPILEAVRTLNSYGMEVVSGIIIGLDTDTPTTGERIVQFIELSGIPMLTINILHALPRTPLWRRLEAEGRLLDGAGRESNVDFRLPYETVVSMWQECVTRAYSPEAIYARFDHQLRHTYPNRKVPPPTRARVNPRSIARGAGILSRLVWQVGRKADYRQRFWQMAKPNLRRLKIEEVIHVGVVSHHMIEFARECARGEGEKCFYAPSRTPAISG
ncbi:MAG: B12-binding domain-containing radical SAM protein [Armatimonadota bacterium]